jgi:hypothetical protein
MRTKIETLSDTTPIQLSIEDVCQMANTLVVQNVNDSGFIYLGTENVSTTNYGFKLYTDQAFTIELRPYDRLWAISSTSGMIAAVMIVERAS